MQVMRNVLVLILPNIKFQSPTASPEKGLWFISVSGFPTESKRQAP